MHSKKIGVQFTSRLSTKIILQVILLAIFSTSVGCEWAMRTWIVNTNVTIGSRYWDDFVTVGSFTFNSSMTHAIAIPSVEGELDECELIYPLDKLPASVSSDLYNTTVEDICDDKELLDKMERVFWLDPRNWETRFYTPWTFPFSEAVPHIERIPCEYHYDHVHIPNTTSTFIILPPNPVSIASLSIGDGLSMSPEDWKVYSKEEYAQRHFVDKWSRDLGEMFDIDAQPSCREWTGCTCRKFDYTKEICAFVANDCAKDLPCETPITPIGHCCSICGAAVMVIYDESTFIYMSLELAVSHQINIQKREMKYEVHAYMSKVSDHLIQIVLLLKNGYSKDLLDVANGLKSLLDASSDLGIKSCWIEEAGKPIGGHQVWSKVTIILVGLAITVIAVSFLVYRNKFKWFNEGKGIHFCEGLKFTQLGEDKNLKYERTTARGDEGNNAQNETITDNTSLLQQEQQIDPINTSDRLI